MVSKTVDSIVNKDSEWKLVYSDTAPNNIAQMALNTVCWAPSDEKKNLPEIQLANTDNKF